MGKSWAPKWKFYFEVDLVTRTKKLFSLPLSFFVSHSLTLSLSHSLTLSLSHSLTLSLSQCGFHSRCYTPLKRKGYTQWERIESQKAINYVHILRVKSTAASKWRLRVSMTCLLSWSLPKCLFRFSTNNAIHDRQMMCRSSCSLTRVKDRFYPKTSVHFTPQWKALPL